jgi:hypothetical protein
VLDWLRRALARTSPPNGERFERRVGVEEKEPPSERFVLSIALMIVFFIGLVVLEIASMVFLGEWNDVIFNGIMLVVGSLIGALFGYRETP